MSKPMEAAHSELKSAFGHWVRFDRLERKLYSHDIGVIPKLIKPITGTGIAGAVVQPGSEQDVIRLMEIAKRHALKVTPRGAATSGYGGAIPSEGAIVVDTGRLTGVVDRKGSAITVKAGTVWKDLEEELNKDGLSLRLYPSSAPSSTVGGWLAQGGTGYGGYQYGWFRQNVVSARVVLPTGGIKKFSGADLELIADANGTTGIITEVTLEVREKTEDKVIAIQFADEVALTSALKTVSKAHAPIWSIGFINPTAARLKAVVPLKTHHGHPVHEHRPELPESYIALFVYSTDNAAKVEPVLDEVAKSAGATRLSDEIAEHEWAERFNPMKIKRIAPSLIAAEVVVPVSNLAEVLKEIDEKIELPFVIEGTVAKGDEVILLGFIPHDERSFKFTLAYGLSLSVAKIAKQHGGRVYTTGIYFRKDAPEVLGAERAGRLAAFKHMVDPSGRFNPGKVVGKGLLDTVMKLAETFDPIIRLVGNRAKTPVGERFAKEINGIPADVAWYAYACAQCGYCEKGCTQFYGRGWQSHSPRGKWYFLKEVIEGREKVTAEDVDRFLVCTTCERCDTACQLDLPIEPSWGRLRGKFIQEEKRMTFPAFEMMAASMRKERNIWAAYAEDRDVWFPEEHRDRVKEKAKYAYFAGCTASFVEQDIGKATVTLLDKADVDFAYLGKEEACCGIPMLVAGRWDVFEEILRYNIGKMKETGAETVITSCPACRLVWDTIYPEWAHKLGIDYPFKAQHYSEVLAEKIKEGKLEFDHEVPMKVAFHDSCHIGRASGVYEPPRELIKAIPGVEFVEMEHNRENGLCCGSVLTLIGETPVAPELGKKRIQEAEDVDADTLVALCPCCQFQLRVSADKTGTEMPVKDLASLAAKGLGVDFPDSTPDALGAWAIFEKMIYLMKPDAMVNLMDKLMPQLVAAMPGPFPKMMCLMSRIPGALDAMRPVMPKMMPMMLPGMMPKVMPDMLKEVERIVGPLPKHMSEQMPDLLPTTMEALMPNMLPMIAPGVTDKMIAYLKKNCKLRSQTVEA